MDIKGLQLATRFALPPNSLGYCGRDSAPEKFKKCFISGECVGVEEELSKFPVLYPYLQTNSEIISKDLYSHEVVESYWLGNKHLNKAKLSDYEILLKNFENMGIPDWFVAELREKPPTEFIPTHMFQILHVGVGKVTGSVPFNITTINNCMIRWGTVTKLNVSKNTFEAEITQLKISSNSSKYEFDVVLETFEYNQAFLPSLIVGSTIAAHWKQVVKVLDSDEVSNLEYWTKRVIDSVKPEIDA